MSVSGTKRPPKRPKGPRASGSNFRAISPLASPEAPSRLALPSNLLRRGDEPPDLVRVLAPGRGLDAGVDVHGPGPDGGHRARHVVAREATGQDDRDPRPRRRHGPERAEQAPLDGLAPLP